MKLSKNHVFHDRSKHIKIKFYYIKYMVHRGAVKIQYVATEKKIIDLLTKPLEIVKFKYFKERAGVI